MTDSGGDPPTVALVVGGRGSQALRETLVAAGADRTWCAVPTESEAIAVGGLAETLILDPWPGTSVALAHLAKHTERHRSGAIVVVLRAGTILKRATLARALQIASTQDWIFVPTRRGSLASRIRLSAYRRARMDPGSGTIVSEHLFSWLIRQGWLRGSGLTIAKIRRSGAKIGVLTHALERPSQAPLLDRPTITILIPAHNEVAYLGDTLRAIERQTVPPDEVIVVDDASSDATGDVARSFDVRVVRPPVPQGSKAIATNFGLPFVRTEAVMVLDADTQLHPEAVEHLSDDLRRGLGATSGACLPLYQRGIWSRGRAVEYSMAIKIHKPVQHALGTLVVMSGCISMFRTETVRALGGFSDRTLAEDIDATWAHQIQGGKAGYTAKAMSYPAEPATWKLYRSQMRRWASGFYQTVGFHKTKIRRKPGLALIVAASLWDVVTVPVMFFIVAGMAAAGIVPWRMMALFGLFMLLPLWSGIAVIGWRATLRNFPAFLITQFANSYFYVEALFVEWIARRKRVAWVKGH